MVYWPFRLTKPVRVVAPLSALMPRPLYEGASVPLHTPATGASGSLRPCAADSSRPPIFKPDQLGLPDLAQDLLELPPSYNLAPTQRASVILDRGTGRQVTRLAWGLLPFWAKAKSLQGSTINARIETLATKPAFRTAFKKRRCVVPMAGYYEWSVSPDDGNKDPWFIHAAGPLLAAGLWEYTSPLLTEGNLGTFTIITGDSSGVSADILDRMPVWLQPGQVDDWMAAEPDEAMTMLLASEPPVMEAYRVSRAVNSPRNNVEDLLQPVA
nr:SOS response-associated peptidase [Stenotrophomonas lacuserhaii]